MRQGDAVMPDDAKPGDAKPDDLEDLSRVPELSPEEEAAEDERIRRKLEGDMRRAGFGPDPAPKPSALPIPPCPKDAGGKHQWRFFHNYNHPLTQAPMSKYICGKCQQQWGGPLGQQPPP